MKNRSGNSIRIIIADDHPLFRKAVRDTLEQQEDFEIVAEAQDGEEAVNRTLELVPDVIVMDISMPVVNGIEATRQIKARCPGTSVLVLTVHNDIEHILGILEAGASGYLTKSVLDAEIATAVRSVFAGETIIATSVFQQVLKYATRYMPRTTSDTGGDSLSARELEILKLAAKGISNKDIAQRLELSPRTVKSYMVELFAKMNVSNRTEAVITGLRAGLISLDDD
jgi:two-component system, NarL family, response regulator LiaR